MGGQQCGEIGITVSGAKEGFEIQALSGEKAGVEMAVGGQARPVAARAEGGGHRGDEAHFAPTIGIAPAAFHGPGVPGEGLQRAYRSGCDPRLNRSQSLEMAFLIAQMIRE